MKNRIFNENIVAIRKNAQSLQYNIRPLFAFGLLCNNQKIKKYKKTKNLKTNYTLFGKAACFLLIRETKRSMTNF